MALDRDGDTELVRAPLRLVIGAISLDESKVEAIDKMGAMLTLPEEDRVLELVLLRKQRKRA